MMLNSNLEAPRLDTDEMELIRSLGRDNQLQIPHKSLSLRRDMRIPERITSFRLKGS